MCVNMPEEEKSHTYIGFCVKHMTLFYLMPCPRSEKEFLKAEGLPTVSPTHPTAVREHQWRKRGIELISAT